MVLYIILWCNLPSIWWSINKPEFWSTPVTMDSVLNFAKWPKFDHYYYYYLLVCDSDLSVTMWTAQITWNLIFSTRQLIWDTFKRVLESDADVTAVWTWGFPPTEHAHFTVSSLFNCQWWTNPNMEDHNNNDWETGSYKINRYMGRCFKQSPFYFILFYLFTFLPSAQNTWRSVTSLLLP